jgi:uncharacterized protein (DUF2147 family)
MKALIIYFLVIICYVPGQESDIVGIWDVPENETQVDIKKEGNIYRGIIIKSQKEEAIGKEILREVKEKDGKWEGKLYAIKKDRLLDAMLTLNGDNLEIEISAGIRGKTVIWTRAN